jgi:hypothetical protein
MVERADGSRIVTAAYVVLTEQVRLMPHEVDHAIELLVSRGLVERVGERDLKILATDTPHLTEPSAENSLGSVRKLTPLKLTGRVDDPKGRQIPTVEEIYAMLLSRHREVVGERLVTGAVPTLQLDLKVGSAVAIRMLERLQDDGLLKAKDGWRTLVLLAEGEVQDSRPAMKEETILRMERSAARARLIIRKGALTKFAFDRARKALEEAIAELETIGVQVHAQLDALRTHRHEIQQAELAYEDSLKQSEVAVATTDALATSLKPPEP